MLIAITLLSTLLQAQPSVGDVGWLTGCWRSASGTRTVTEQWLPPEGGTMLGVSRTVSNGRTVEYEFIVLRAGSNGLEYAATPSGQRPAVFTSTTVSDSEAVFENPAHDFPTRISYRKVKGGLVAAISGLSGGKPRTIEFRYVAADCSK
jgi:hypothetical protein